MSGSRGARVGVVLIGRNEGERLARCLDSVLASTPGPAVYVDSGSTDGSRELARARGVEVIALDESRPHTAARGRNAGLDWLRASHPELDYVQFVDGDCEVQTGWIDAAAAYLDAHPDVSVVCGRRRERFPDRSPYNRLADIEWNTPLGEAEACGGDALVRISELAAIGGYDPDLIAGEDPEMCYRIRRAGGRVVRLDREMTLHDADMLRFAQWWRRTTRAGHAYAETVAMHGRAAGRVARRLASILLWGPGVLLVAAAATWVLGPAGLLVPGAWALLWVRVFRDASKRLDPRGARLFATACVIGKLAEAQGVLEYAWNRWVRRRSSRLIEYKGPVPDGER